MASYHQKALSLAQQGDWDGSHTLIQQYEDDFSKLIHGYLHKVEGDLSNAAYWYRLAGEDNPDCSLEEELGSLIQRANKLL